MTRRPKEVPDAGHPLTDNDKSAYYIDWVAHHYDYVHRFWRDENEQRSPDLSDPRNYMKALEVAGRFLIHSEESDSSWRVTITKHGLMVKGATPVEALAAFYDAEHPTE